MPALRTEASDAALIERTRRGDRSAYGELWRRHAASGRTVARSYSTLDPDDLVSESFTKIYDAILAGGGPTGAFRPYLFTTIRNTAASWGRARHETTLETLESFEDPSTSESASLDALDRSTTAQAFRSLPTRWQEVLWYSEVEAMAPQQISALVGMSANATAALAYRAREGLRQAWIQAHLRNAVDEPDCRWTIERLGSYTRGRLRTRDTARLEAHLDDCARCTIVAAEAREVGSRLALVMLPLTAGIGGATAYSAWLSQGAPAVDVALGAAGVPAAFGGSGSGAGAGAVAGSGSGAASAGSGGGASTGTGGATGSGIAIGAGVGALALAAAVAAVMVVPTLIAADEPPAPDAIVAEASGRNDVPLPGLAGPVLPTPVPPRPIDTDDVDESGDAPPVETAPPASGGPGRATEPAPPAPGPTDAVAPPPSFTADTAGGLVDPILTGTAEPGAAIVVSAGDSTWTATADASGSWSVAASGLPAGATVLTARQTDAAGNMSGTSSPVTVLLQSPALELRQSSPITCHAAFAGVPSAQVEMLVDGSVVATRTLDAGGSARDVLLGWVDPDRSFGVRYTAGGRTGPVVAAAFVVRD